MTPGRFEQLLSWVAPYIFKSSERRPNTSPHERLSITLRYLATGDSQFTIGCSYRVHPTTIGRIILETTTVIWNQLCKRGYLDHPNNEEKWKKYQMIFLKCGTFQIA